MIRLYIRLGIDSRGVGDYSTPVMWHFLPQHLYVLRVYPDY